MGPAAHQSVNALFDMVRLVTDPILFAHDGEENLMKQTPWKHNTQAHSGEFTDRIRAPDLPRHSGARCNPQRAPPPLAPPRSGGNEGSFRFLASDPTIPPNSVSGAVTEARAEGTTTRPIQATL